MYDPALGRWHVQDNFSEFNPSFSPYNYVQDNPLRYIDPDGNSFWESKEIRNARYVAKETGGEFHRWKSEDGTKHFSITSTSYEAENPEGDVVIKSIEFTKEKKEDWKLKNGIPYYGSNEKGGESGLSSEDKEEGVDMSEFGISPLGLGNLFDLCKKIGIKGIENNDNSKNLSNDQNNETKEDSVVIRIFHDDGQYTISKKIKVPKNDLNKYENIRDRRKR